MLRNEFDSSEIPTSNGGFHYVKLDKRYFKSAGASESTDSRMYKIEIGLAVLRSR